MEYGRGKTYGNEIKLHSKLLQPLEIPTGPAENQQIMLDYVEQGINIWYKK